MSIHQVGQFEVEISGPYPVRVCIRDMHRGELDFSHEHLRDLQYAVERAIREARLRLKGDKDEV